MNGDSLLHRALLVSGRYFFRVRNVLFPLVLLAILAFGRPAELFGSPGLDKLAMAVGIAAVLAGQALRLAVIGYAYIRRGGKNREVYANELVTRGFYAHTRNPMYVGNYMIVTGFALVFGSAAVVALVAAFFAWVYLAITTAEETFLRDKFGGDYQDYARRVNRFVPRLQGLRASLAEFEYDWRRVLVKEYNTLCFTLAAVLGLIIWKIVYLYGYAEHLILVRSLGFAWVPLAVFYGVVRYLKKTHRLQPLRATESEQVISRPSS
jgi:protein-S-isoprenylcysteine O-methyltransferase Ste14